MKRAVTAWSVERRRIKRVKVARNKMRRSRKESESFCAALLSILGVVILCAPLSAASVFCLADSAVEETPEAQISPAAVAVSKLQVGISGVYKSGVPTRVAVSWQGDASNLSFLELETVDSDGTPFFSRYEIGDSEKEQGRIEASGYCLREDRR